MKKMKAKALYISFAVAFIFAIGASVLSQDVYADEVNTYNVVDYGANGSDTSSDRNAIQTALNIAKTTDKAIKVYVPDGTYYLDEVLLIYSNTTLELSDNAIIKRSSNYSGIMIANAADDNQEYGGYARTKNIVITGGAWNGATTNPSSYDNNLYFGHAENVVISNTKIMNCYGAHLLELTGVKNATITNVSFSDFYSSGNASEDSAKEALQLDRPTKINSELYAPYDESPCVNITIAGCTFNNYPCAIGSHTRGAKITDVTIENNTFSNITYNLIQLIDYTNFEIKNNVQVSSANLPEKFIMSSYSSGDILGNTVVGASTNALYICDTSNVTIEGNNIKNATLSGVRVTNSTAKVNDNIISACKNCGVFADESSTISAKSNTITNCLVAAMSSSKCASVEFDSNTISDCTEKGIMIAYGNSNTYINKNNISVTGDYPIILFGGNGSVVRKNTIAEGFSGYGVYVRESYESEKSSKVQVLYNVITGGEQGIGIRNANSTTVMGNKVAEREGGSIYVANTCSKTIVHYNDFGDKILVFDSSAIVEYNDGEVYKEVKQGPDGKWYYYENDEINYDYTGLAQNSAGWWYIKEGVVDFTHYGVVSYNNVDWYVKGGQVNFNINGLAQCGKDWYYFKGGAVQKVTGLYQNSAGYWYVKNGKLDFTYYGVASNNAGTWYVKDGQVNFSINGLAQCGSSTDWYYFKGGAVQNVTGLYQNSAGYWYVKNGKIDFNYTGLANNSAGYWYVKNGKIDFSYFGVASNNAGTWYVKGGQVNFGINGLAQCGASDDWYYFKGGAVQKVTGLYQNSAGYWYVKNGKIDFNYTGLANNSAGYWYVKNGKIDFSYFGVVSNNAGTWYVKGGQVNFGINGLVQCGASDDWYYFKGGAVQNVTGLYQNSAGYWYVKNGKIDFAFTGIAENNAGFWYCANGKVDFTFTGTVVFDEKTYNVVNGKATLVE